VTIRQDGSQEDAEDAKATRATLGPALLERLLAYLQDEIGGCLGAGLHAASHDPDGPIAVTGLAGRLDALQWELDAGPTVHAAREQEAVSSADLRTDDRWPGLPDRIAELPGVPAKVSAVAVAGSWDDQGPIVLSLYLDHEPTPENLRKVEEIEPMLAMSAALVEYCADEILRGDQLLKMVEHRRVIEQAKGMIMAVRRCAAGEAFRALVTSSQHFNVKLRDLAVATVEMLGGAPAEGVPEKVAPDEQMPSPEGEARQAAELMWRALGPS
jgi:hypothetical protein